MKRILFLLAFFTLLSISVLAQSGNVPILITEQDGSPRVLNPSKIVVTNGTLTVQGRTATISTGGGGGGTPGGSDTQLQYNNAGAFGGTTGVTYGGSNLVAMTKDATVDSILKVAETGTTPTGLVGGSPTIVSLVTNAGSFYALGYIDETNDRAIANYVSAPTLAFDFYQFDNTYLGGTYLLDYGGISLNHATHSRSDGYGLLYQSGDNVFALGRSSDTAEANAVDDLTWGARGITQRAPATAISDGDLPTSHLHFYLDEDADQIKVKAKESGGTVLTAMLTGLAARNSSSFAKTSDTTLANITGLSRNVEASRTYAFTAVMQTTAAATGGVKFSVSGTATATAISYEGILMDGAAVVAQTRATALDTAVCASTTSTAGTCTIRGVIQVNAAGTLTVQFAQNASDAGASTVLANQYLQLIPIS